METVKKIKKFAKNRDIKLVETEDENLFYGHWGSAVVYIHAQKLESGEEVIALISNVVEGVKVDENLMKKLLKLNSIIRVGSFALREDTVSIHHSILAGKYLDEEEFHFNVSLVAAVADEYDDKIVSTHGGRKALDSITATVKREAGVKDYWKDENLLDL